MARILLAGIGPLPSEGEKQLFAPGLRVSIFAETLRGTGHEVRLALGQFGQDLPLDETLKAQALEFRPEAIVATTDIMASAAARARLPIPLWVDFYGAPMAERQQQSALHAHDGGLAAAWRTIVPALLAADHFSTCSNAQRLALIGELGACGRLNHLTAGHDLVSVIPPGLAIQDAPQADAAIRGPLVPKDAFIVLWTGGFNTWTDIDTLHAGLVEAMNHAPQLHFVSTGGAIPGHCETVYPAFQQRVEQGPHRERFHLLGWIDLPRVQAAWREADLAVNIDRFSYEGLLGTRTRLLDWMHARLPIATTCLSELNCRLVNRLLAYGFEINNSASLAATILRAIENPEETQAMAQRAHAFLREEWRNEQLLAPLLEWAEKPQFAPDRRHGGSVQNSLAAAQAAVLEQSTLQEELERLRSQNYDLQSQLSRLQGSRLIRAVMQAKKIPLLKTEER